MDGLTVAKVFDTVMEHDTEAVKLVERVPDVHCDTEMVRLVEGVAFTVAYVLDCVNDTEVVYVPDGVGARLPPPKVFETDVV